jgi:hypothetical protein
MIVVVGEWEDDMMRAVNNFKLNSLANKTIEKLTMGVVNYPPSFTGFRSKPREGGMVFDSWRRAWQKMAGQGRSFPIK